VNHKHANTISQAMNLCSAIAQNQTLRTKVQSTPGPHIDGIYPATGDASGIRNRR
jgi:hypothetical protein